MTSLPYIEHGTRFGDTSSREWRNAMDAVQAINSLTVGDGLTLSRSPSLLHIGLSPKPVDALVPGTSVRRAFLLKEIRDDYLVCRMLDVDGVEAATDTMVAKPWLLQRTPFDGKVRNGNTLTYAEGAGGTKRTSTHPDPDDASSTVSEEQLVILRYVVDDLIYATLEIYTGVETADDEKVVWQSEYTGRNWTRENGQ